MPYDTNDLPTGWVAQYDDSHSHPFWVDTKANPPRAIWTHPYEDEQFLNEHPEIRQRIGKNGGEPNASLEPPPPYTPRRHSYSGSPGSGPSGSGSRPHASQPGTPAIPADRSGQAHRGFFGKLKDKAVGTKEEREAARRQEALLMQRRAEQRRKQLEELQRQRMSMGSGATYGGSFGQPLGRPGYGQPMYGPPMGSPFGYGGRGRYGGGGFGGGFGGGGMAMPLIGGLAGGLLLGDMLDGGFGGGGFDGGGGGDFF